MRSESKVVESACITQLRVATNCPMGGDSGYGGKTVFEISDLGSTDLSVSIDDEFGNYHEFEFVKIARIRLGGDCEAENFCKLLRWAADALESMLDKNKNASKS